MGNPAKNKQLEELINILILPLLKCKPENYNFQNWLDFCFATHRVEIQRWRVVSRGVLPAKRLIFFNKYFDSQIKLNIGDILFTRIDYENPTKVIVEIVNRKNQRFEESRIYKIDDKTWRRMQAYIVVKPFVERNRPKMIDWSSVLK